MQYLPGIGKRGILAYIGGSSKSVSEVSNVAIGKMVCLRFSVSRHVEQTPHPRVGLHANDRHLRH